MTNGLYPLTAALVTVCLTRTLPSGCVPNRSRTVVAVSAAALQAGLFALAPAVRGTGAIFALQVLSCSLFGLFAAAAAPVVVVLVLSRTGARFKHVELQQGWLLRHFAWGLGGAFLAQAGLLLSQAGVRPLAPFVVRPLALDLAHTGDPILLAIALATAVAVRFAVRESRLQPARLGFVALLAYLALGAGLRMSAVADEWDRIEESDLAAIGRVEAIPGHGAVLVTAKFYQPIDRGVELGEPTARVALERDGQFYTGKQVSAVIANSPEALERMAWHRLPRVIVKVSKDGHALAAVGDLFAKSDEWFEVDLPD